MCAARTDNRTCITGACTISRSSPAPSACVSPSAARPLQVPFAPDRCSKATLPVYSFRREDVGTDLIEPTNHRTRCHQKGEASFGG